MRQYEVVVLTIFKVDGEKDVAWSVVVALY